jgi:deoxyribodipyrimidine photo-lyase
MATSVLWFRRDLRLQDHPALQEAAASSDDVLGLYVVEPPLWTGGGRARAAFLAGCITDLDHATGGQLLIRQGDPLREVVDVARAVGATAVYVTASFTPWGRRRDGAVRAALEAHRIELRSVSSDYAVAPGQLLSGSGAGYRVFGAFQRAWQRAHVPEPAASAAVTWHSPEGLAAVALPPTVIDGKGPAPGEAAAHRRLEEFLAHDLARYAAERDHPASAATSALSPYLRFGCIHPRTVLWELESVGGDSKFRSELCWREFSADVLWNQPVMAWTTLRPQLRPLRWDRGAVADSHFEAWSQGRTGYPIVDAGMRELLATGIMHNRVRMITASFLVKDLHLEWQLGARWFLQHLIDGDLASNSQNWQWVAGTGLDPAPFFRIFNPVTQGRTFDPGGEYVRRWIPELAGVDDRHVHEPWTASPAPTGYPAPIVDHAVERRDALVRFGEVTGGGQ